MPIVILMVLIAVVGGVAAGVQVGVVGLVNQRLSTLESVFITYFGGGLVILAILLLANSSNLAEWRKLPWYALLGGPLGLVIIGTLSITVPRLGVAAATAVFIAAQLTISALLDHFGLLGAPVRSLDLSRLIGMAVLFGGAWLILR